MLHTWRWTGNKNHRHHEAIEKQLSENIICNIIDNRSYFDYVFLTIYQPKKLMKIADSMVTIF